MLSVGASRCADLPIIDDNLAELAETFEVILQLSSPKQNSVIDTATVTIISDDCKFVSVCCREQHSVWEAIICLQLLQYH